MRRLSAGTTSGDLGSRRHSRSSSMRHTRLGNLHGVNRTESGVSEASSKESGGEGVVIGLVVAPNCKTRLSKPTHISTCRCLYRGPSQGWSTQICARSAKRGSGRLILHLSHLAAPNGSQGTAWGGRGGSGLPASCGRGPRGTSLCAGG